MLRKTLIGLAGAVAISVVAIAPNLASARGGGHGGGGHGGGHGSHGGHGFHGGGGGGFGFYGGSYAYSGGYNCWRRHRRARVWVC
jgi:hypothetical protein